MLPFLTKLASYLDEHGQYTIAQEVDVMINKLAQQAGMIDIPGEERKQQLYEQTLQEPIIAPPPPVTPVSLYDTLRKVVQTAQVQSMSRREGYQQVAQQLFEEVNQGIERSQLPKEIIDVVDELQQALLHLARGTTPPGDLTQGAWKIILEKAAAAMNTVGIMEEPKAVSPIKVPTKHKSNALIVEAQRLLGVKESGIWDGATNTAFINAIQQNYPTYLKGGKFQGTLANAVGLLRNIEGLRLIESKPSAPPPVTLGPWRSKKFKLDSPIVQEQLGKLDKQIRPGAAQDLINIVERRDQDQATFEELLKEYAEKY